MQWVESDQAREPKETFQHGPFHPASISRADTIIKSYKSTSQNVVYFVRCTVCIPKSMWVEVKKTSQTPHYPCAHWMRSHTGHGAEKNRVTQAGQFSHGHSISDLFLLTFPGVLQSIFKEWIRVIKIIMLGDIQPHAAIPAGDNFILSSVNPSLLLRW